MIGTLEEFKRFLDLENVSVYDTLLSDVLLSANSWLTVLCNQSLEYSSVTDWLDGNGTSYIMLKRFPVKEITCIASYSGADWDTYDLGDDYLTISKYGEIYHSDGFPTGFQNIKVDYQAGYEETDPEYSSIKWLVYEIGAIIFRNRGVTNLLTVDQGVTFTRLENFLSPEVRMLIDKYTIRGV